MPRDDAAAYFNPRSLLNKKNGEQVEKAEISVSLSQGVNSQLQKGGVGAVGGINVANGVGGSVRVPGPRSGSFMVSVTDQQQAAKADKLNLSDDPFALAPKSPQAGASGSLNVSGPPPNRLPVQQEAQRGRGREASPIRMQSAMSFTATSPPAVTEVRRGREASPMRLQSLQPTMTSPPAVTDVVRGREVSPIRVRAYSPIRANPPSVLRSTTGDPLSVGYGQTAIRAGSHAAAPLPGGSLSVGSYAAAPQPQLGLSASQANGSSVAPPLDQLSASTNAYALPQQALSPTVVRAQSMLARGEPLSLSNAANVYSGASVKVKVAPQSSLPSSDGISRFPQSVSSLNPPVYRANVLEGTETAVSQAESEAARNAAILAATWAAPELLGQSMYQMQMQDDLQAQQEAEAAEQQQALADVQYYLSRSAEAVQYALQQELGIQPADLPYQEGYTQYNEGEYVEQQYLENMQVQPGDGYGQEYIEYVDPQVDADAAAGIPRHMEEKPDILQALQEEMLATRAQMESAQEPQKEEDEDQFTRLLNSLEARVDLMAQMQHTRAQIQKHTRSLQASNPERRPYGSPDPSPLSDEGAAYGGDGFNLPEVNEQMALDYDREERMSIATSGTHPAETQFVYQNFEGNSGTHPAETQFAYQHFEGNGVGQAHAQEFILQTGPGAEMVASDPMDAGKLVRENQILWHQFQDQRDCISKLNSEVEGMRTQLRAISTEPGRRGDTEPGTPENRGSQAASAASLLLSQLTTPALGRDVFSMPTQPAANVFSMPTQTGPAGGDMVPPQEPGSEEARYDELVRSERDVEVKSLHLQLLQERQRQEASSLQWDQERRRLIEELSSLRRKPIGGLPTVGEHGTEDVSEAWAGFSSRSASKTETVFPDYAGAESLATDPVLPAGGLAEDAFRGLFMPGRSPRQVQRLCDQPIGINVELSEDGYAARRTRGCRQSVVIGSSPLDLQEQGWYFEVVVRETVNGWVGGLGIGVTRTAPSELRRLPDKGWRIPGTFIVGYWGCVFLDGRERRTKWKADSLEVGSKVGLLITGDGKGDLIVFVDGCPVVRADGVLPSAGQLDSLYPVIDIFAATLSVELQRTAKAPSPPWDSNPSPPGSPASVARSTISSLSALDSFTGSFKM